MLLIPAGIKAVLTKPSQSMAARSRVPVIFLGIPAENSRQFALNVARTTYDAPALCLVVALGSWVREIGASAP